MTAGRGDATRRGSRLPLIVVAIALAGGILAIALGSRTLGDAVLGGGLLVVAVPLVLQVVARIRRGQIGADVVALLAIVGALALREFLAGAVIALMLAGGDYLDELAFRRARRDLAALARRAPTIAHRDRDGSLTDIDVAAVAIGDRLVIKVGELVPVDGRIDSADGALDESTITGESRPVAVRRGDAVRSGAIVIGRPITIVAAQPAAASTYARIVALVEGAEAARAPTVRLADRAAALFLPLTIALAVGGFWWTGDPRTALAVLVVATPCPLILATPIAFISGTTQAARHGVIVKGGDVLERLAQTAVVAFDKTGTLTTGVPATDDPDAESLRLAASVDQLSTHPLAVAIVRDARRRGLELTRPEAFSESHGDGASGRVGGRLVRVGRPGYVGAEPLADGHATAIYVSADGRVLPSLRVVDPIRPEAHEIIVALRLAGLEVVLLSGDDREVVGDLARHLGIDDPVAEATPADKVLIVERLRERHGAVAMIGDGVNDAPALARADVGIAIATAGATVAADVADAVLVDPDLTAIARVVGIARRTVRIARSGIALGMGLSVALMIVASTGRIDPVAGAIGQEAIDVLAILNALRAAR